MSIKRILLFIILVFSVQNTVCQTNFDEKIEYALNHFQYDSAYIFTQKAIKNSKDDSEKKADYYITYTKILKSLFRTDSCFYYIEKAENFYTKQQDQSKLFHILSIKAEIARSLVKRNMANNYIYRAEKLLPENKNLEYKYYFLNRRIALLAEYYNNVPDSVKKIKEIGNYILLNKKEVKDKSIITYTLNEIGYLDFNSNPKNAQTYFLKAYEIAQKNDSKMALIDVSINLGRYYQQKETNYPTAIYYFEKALIQAKKINNLWQMQQCYNELKNTSNLSQDYKSAMHYGDSLNGVNNQLTDYNNNIKYGLLENKFILESKEKELIAAKKNFFLLITVLILFLIGITVLIFYSKKIRAKNTQLSKLYKENEFLLSETNHRVNNNLQLIALLISDTLRKKQSEENKLDFTRLLTKVETIASLHRHLYLTKNADKINLQKYLSDVRENFDDIAQENNIEIKFEIDSIKVKSDYAMYLGLLVTELFINSVKHAFNQLQSKKVSLTILKKEENYTFIYSDNGEKAAGKTINPKLVNQLCLQLDVKYEIDTTEGFKLIFNKKSI